MMICGNWDVLFARGLRAMFMVLVGVGAISFVVIDLSAFVDSNGEGARLLPADSVAVENSA